MATTSDPFVPVGARVPPDLVEMIEKDADRLGLSRADWVRAAFHRQLTVSKLTKTMAGRYRRPNTRAGQREYNGGWRKKS